MLNRTSEFRHFVEECRKSLPDAKRIELSRQDRRARVGHGGTSNPVLSTKEYMTEAYKILNHIATLSRMLASVRRPYLNVDLKNPLLPRKSSRSFELEGSEQPWNNIRHLDNEERDQIDLQARVILSRCADRVKEMELLEQNRAGVVANQTNPILRLLPLRLRQGPALASSEFVAAHHTGITWYLNRRLAEVSQNQKEMQEERIRREMERAKTLGSGATQEAVTLEMSPVLGVRSDKSGSWLDGVNGTSSLASSLTSSLNGSISTFDSSHTQAISQSRHQPILDNEDGSYSDEDADNLNLTSSQIMQFETENANILRSVQDVLASVQLAESRLLDISALQMELVTHLTQQTSITEQLYEDAIATSTLVDKGNVQLREAKRRGKDGRIFILLFLFGASLGLLFIHYY